MRQLSPEKRRRWQSTTLATPRRRYGADARLLFKLEDLVFGPARTLPKFRARELIARTPYQSWEQAAYLKADQQGNGRSRAEKLFRTANEDRAEQDNEEWHIILLEEQIAISGVHANPIRFQLLPQLIAFAVYQQFWLLRVLNRPGATGSTPTSRITPSPSTRHWSPSIRSGRPLHSARRSRPATGPTIRWPTCSARSAATKASTRKLASPA